MPPRLSGRGEGRGRAGSLALAAIRCLIALLLTCTPAHLARPSQGLLAQLPSPQEFSKHLLSAIVELTLAEMPPRKCLGVFIDSGKKTEAMSERLLWRLRHLKRPYAVLVFDLGDARPSTDFHLRCDNYIVLLGRGNGPRQMWGAVKNSLLRVREDKPLRRFIYTWPWDPDTTRGILDATTAAIWRAYHLNAVVLARPPLGSGHNTGVSDRGVVYAIYGLRPFDPTGLGCNVSTARHVAHWTLHDGLNLAAGSSAIFPYGSDRALRYLKMEGCPLRIGIKNTTAFVRGWRARNATNHWKFLGTGAYILQAVVQVLHFKREIAWVPKDDSRDLDSWDAGLLEVTRRAQVDIAVYPTSMGTAPKSVQLFLLNQCGSYTNWCYTFGTPLGTTEAPPLYHKITGAFGARTWRAVAFSLLLAWAWVRILLRCTRNWTDQEDDKDEARPDPWRTNSPLFILMRLLVGMPRSPVPRGSALKTFLVFWLYMALVLSTAYTTALWSQICALNYPETVASVKQLADSNLTVYGHDDSLRQLMFAAEKNEEFATILKRSRTLRNERDLLALVSCPKAAIVTRRDWLIYSRRRLVENELRNKMGSERQADCTVGAIHVFRGYCLFTQYGSPMLVPNGSPYRLAITRTLMALNEAGLTDHWTEENERWSPPTAVINVWNAGVPRLLTLGQVYPLFAVYYIVLFLVCTSVFIVEILADWVERHWGWSAAARLLQ